MKQHSVFMTALLCATVMIVGCAAVPSDLFSRDNISCSTDLFGTITKYDGELREGKPHGRGVAILDDGSRIDGEWFDGKPHGRMVLTNQDEEIAIGDFYRDRAIVTVPDEDMRIECEERGNMTNIFFTMQDGERFGVELRGNMRNGRMIGTLPSGVHFEAEIRNGKPVWAKRVDETE